MHTPRNLSSIIGRSDQSCDPACDKLWTIIKTYRVALLTALTDTGSLFVQPLHMIQRKFGGTLWFFTPAKSPAARAVANKEQVCVSYMDSQHDDFVSLTGSASTITADVIKGILWNPAVRAWFPHDVTSPELVLIKIDTAHAEYWNNENRRSMRLFPVMSAAH